MPLFQAMLVPHVGPLGNKGGANPNKADFNPINSPHILKSRRWMLGPLSICPQPKHRAQIRSLDLPMFEQM